MTNLGWAARGDNTLGGRFSEHGRISRRQAGVPALIGSYQTPLGLSLPRD
jgi:hypothetical protein